MRDALPVLDDGRAINVANVIWCTGYDCDHSWLDVPAFNPNGQPIHQRGVSAVPGLYFLGLMFLNAASSVMIHGVERDAGYIARAIRARRHHAAAA